MQKDKKAVFCNRDIIGILLETKAWVRENKIEQSSSIKLTHNISHLDNYFDQVNYLWGLDLNDHVS